ncbi:MAG: hypothetical protein VXA00_13520, partial [Rhodospirillales bacterium]
AIDDDIDAGDLRQIFWSMTTRVHAEKDVIKIPNTRIWSLDNASDIVPGMSAMYRTGTKTMIDATKPPESHLEEREKFVRALPKNYDKIDLAQFVE